MRIANLPPTPPSRGAYLPPTGSTSSMCCPDGPCHVLCTANTKPTHAVPRGGDPNHGHVDRIHTSCFEYTAERSLDAGSNFRYLAAQTRRHSHAVSDMTWWGHRVQRSSVKRTTWERRRRHRSPALSSASRRCRSRRRRRHRDPAVRCLALGHGLAHASLGHGYRVGCRHASCRCESAPLARSGPSPCFAAAVGGVRSPLSTVCRDCCCCRPARLPT